MKNHRNPRFRIHNSNSGFTIIELIIFSAVFSVMAVAFLTALVSAIQIQTKQNAAAEVNQQSQTLLDTIQYYVQSASLVEIPADTATTTLKLRTSSSSTDPTYIYLSDSAAYIQQTDGAAGVPLTSSKVNVTGLAFTKRANVPGHDSVNVNFTMEYNSDSPSQAFLQNLQISVARVGAATFDSNVVPSTSNTYKIGATSQVWQSINDVLYFNGSNVGVDVTSPTQLFQVGAAGGTVGDIYIAGAGNGIILKAPNGTSCYKLTITNTGGIATSSVSCT